MAAPLEQYLRMYRRRSGLSQAEVGRLAGLDGGSDMSRNETGARVPDLDRAILYALVLRAPIEELFQGRFDELRQVLAPRVEALRDGFHVPGTRDRRRDMKVRHLSAVLDDFSRMTTYGSRQEVPRD